MNYYKRTTEITVGGPPPVTVDGDGDHTTREYDQAPGPEEKVRISFANFAHLAKGKDEAVASPKFVCLGKEWILTVYPGGITKAVGDVPPPPPPEDEEEDPACVAMFLTLCDPDDEVKVIFDITLTQVDGSRYNRCPDEHTFGGDKSNIHGWADYIGRSLLLNEYGLQKDGAVTFEVCMKRDVEGYGLGYEPFLPPNPFLQNLAKMFPFMDGESCDVVFLVEDKGDPKSGKATFPAHRIILEASGSSLFHMLGEGEDDSAGVEINDVNPTIFRHLLRNIYGLSIPATVLKGHAKELIDSSDKYGVVHLKLQAEAWYCKTTAIEMRNVMDNLHFAESKNLALLKEKVMSFLMDHGREVVSELKLDDLPASSQSFRDILMAVNMERGRGGGNAEDVKAMSVNSLRTKLHEEGLEVDGTREMLVAALESKENDKKRKRDSDDE